VAFEFRWKTVKGQWAWDLSFAAGSTVAAFAQGIALGALVQGIPVEGRAYAGGWWDWLTPFSLLTGVALVVGYALLGACWLIFKTEGELQTKAFRFARITALATLGLIGAVSVITPFLNERFLKRWYSWPDMLWAAPVPILVALCAYGLLLGLTERRKTRLAWMPLPDVLPFWSALGLFVLSFVGLVISFFPFIVPSSVTIWDAAAPDNSLSFLLVGTVVLLPLILIYTAYSYWVFRGKVDTSGGYH
jgi:cytochrome bd ubiquinol oxidase subunit II